MLSETEGLPEMESNQTDSGEKLREELEYAAEYGEKSFSVKSYEEKKDTEIQFLYPFEVLRHAKRDLNGHFLIFAIEVKGYLLTDIALVKYVLQLLYACNRFAIDSKNDITALKRTDSGTSCNHARNKDTVNRGDVRHTLVGEFFPLDD